jgi:hypothetical protein
MPDITTPVLGLTLPEPGGSRNTWGEKLNNDLSLIDTAVGADRNRLTALEALPIKEYAAVSGAVTLNCNESRWHRLAFVNGGVTLSFSNVPPVGVSVWVEFVTGTATIYGVTWDAGTVRLAEPSSFYSWTQKHLVQLVSDGAKMVFVQRRTV